MLKLIGVPLDKLKFVIGKEFQLKEQYTLDMYKISALATTRDTKRAGKLLDTQTQHGWR